MKNVLMRYKFELGDRRFDAERGFKIAAPGAEYEEIKCDQKLTQRYVGT
jgi:hypothetical protein